MKKVLIVGGGNYQLPLIQRLLEKGNFVYCVDRDPKAPGFKIATGFRILDVLDRNGCLDYAKEIGIDAVMTYGATITLPTVSYIGEKMGLPALPMKTAEISKDKFLIKSCLAEHGCNIKGKFFKMDSMEDSLLYSFEYPCVIKPCDGSGSVGVSVANNESELDNALQYAINWARFGEIYAESYIPGEEYSVEVFVDHDEIHVYAIVKTTFVKAGVDNESISYGHRTPSGLSEMVENAICEEVTKAVQALGVTIGSVNFDVILSKEDGKPYIIDCGIRIGQNLIASHIVPLSRGVNELDNIIALALREDIDTKPKQKKCIATRLLIFNPGTIREIKPMDDLIGQNGVVDVILRKGVGSIQGVYVDKSDNCGWVITQGDTPDEAELRAEKAKQVLREYFVIDPVGR